MDVLAMRNSGLTTKQVAEEAGMTHGALRSKCAREGLSLAGTRNRVRSHREIVQTMRPAEAVEYLLDEIEMLTGYKSDDAWRVQQELGLTPAETTMLMALVKSEGRPLRKEFLLTVMGSEAELSIVNVRICGLRRKLPKGARIVTHWGNGYSFDRDLGFTFAWER